MVYRGYVRFAFCRAPLSALFFEFPKTPSSPRRVEGLQCANRISTTATKRGNPSSIISSSPLPKGTYSISKSTPRKLTKNDLRNSPEFQLKLKLDRCAKSTNLEEALSLYEEARKTNTALDLRHYNALLYVCSAAACSDGNTELGLRKGFEIYRQMTRDNISPDEATFTNAARLAFAAEDPEMAFTLIHEMKAHKIPPKLRSYGPALRGFCNKGLIDRAFDVDRHMLESGITAEEPELSSLFKVCAEKNEPQKVYGLMQRLRGTIRQVSGETSKLIEDWFLSENASEIGTASFDVSKIKESMSQGGGGWHGHGWLGTGKWKVVKTQVNGKGICLSCRQTLVPIDINERETEDFAESLNSLAMANVEADGFTMFKKWLERGRPFDAVIDGANVGLYNGKSFDYKRINTVANMLREMSRTKRNPLIVLHRKRVRAGPEHIVSGWRKMGMLYETPVGANDDWFWLYGAVRNRCVVVTNDEMRDHIFELLGTSFFPRWKEKHQMRLSVTRNGVKLRMPPSYSIVIQENERGDWHVPTLLSDDDDRPREWLCCTRPFSA